MKLKIKGADLSTLGARERLLGFLSRTIDADGYPPSEGRFKPYRANEGEDASWVIDQENNWRCSFFAYDKSLVELSYRYESTTVQAEEALATWLCYCLPATVVDAPLPTHQRIMLDESDLENLSEFWSKS